MSHMPAKCVPCTVDVGFFGGANYVCISTEFFSEMCEDTLFRDLSQLIWERRKTRSACRSLNSSTEECMKCTGGG